MRNHIVIVSEESVYAGYYKCGIGEVVDTLADELRQYYDVTVITPGKSKRIRKARVHTGTYGDDFYLDAAALIQEMQPDLVHNFGRPDFIERLTVDCIKVLSFDRWEEDIADQLDSVPKYDHVTTLSAAYAEEMKAAYPEAAEWPLIGIINGIDGGLYVPGGLFHSHSTREKWRARVFNELKLEDTGKPLIISTGRFGEVKGTAQLIEAIPAIADMGAQLIVAGIGDTEYEKQLQQFHDAGKVYYLPRLGHYCETCVALSAADFYLTPSLHEVCGLQPMKAARMGSVPIVRPVGGMGQNFDKTNAVLITDTISEAVERALALTPDEYNTIRDKAMAGEWTWKTRVLPWVQLYGLETAPPEKSTFRTTKTETGNVTTYSRTSAATNTTPVKGCPFAYKEETANE